MSEVNRAVWNQLLKENESILLKLFHRTGENFGIQDVEFSFSLESKELARASRDRLRTMFSEDQSVKVMIINSERDGFETDCLSIARISVDAKAITDIETVCKQVSEEFSGSDVSWEFLNKPKRLH